MSAARIDPRLLLAGVLLVCLATAGCRSFDFYQDDEELNQVLGPAPQPPRELAKVSLPDYRIEPPDMVSVELFKLIPLPPYRLEVYDALQIDVAGTLLDQPINGAFLIEAEGQVNLGPAYGSVRVVGTTVEHAQTLITDHLKQILRRPEVSVRLLRTSGLQPIAPPNNQYLVGPDGTINLDMYGTVHIAGKTLTEAKLAIEKHLSQFLDSPVVSLKVLAYNSKVYYIITQGAELGDNVARIPITGNETVLDALSQVGGISQISSTKIWIARPAPGNVGCEQILPINWDDIARGALTATNYQVMPGDRVYIAQDDLIALSNYLSRLISPIERLTAFGSLGASTVRTFQTLGRSYNQGRGGY